MADARPKILFVDDEIHVLDGFKLNLRKQYDVHVATDGREALETLLRDGPFQVLVSDLRMPGMGGVELLAEAARRAPHTVRLMLTGQADLPTAMAAINDGRIYRLLLKPCPPQTLCDILDQAAAQYRTLAEERHLAQATLMGAIQALTGTLALSRPAAVARARRIREHSAELAADQRMGERTALEIAAMLSQLGAVALPPELAKRIYESTGELGERERQAAESVPQVAARLLASVPRTEDVRRILESVDWPASGTDGPQGRRLPPPGARILRLAIDYDLLITGGLPPMDALCEMGVREGVYDQSLYGRFMVLRRAELSALEPADLPIERVAVGQMLAEELRMANGHVVAPRGARVGEELLAHMRTLAGLQPGRIFKVLLRPSPPAKAA